MTPEVTFQVKGDPPFNHMVKHGGGYITFGRVTGEYTTSDPGEIKTLESSNSVRKEKTMAAKQGRPPKPPAEPKPETVPEGTTIHEKSHTLKQLERMSLPKLRELAKEREMKLGNARRKDTLVKMIHNRL